MSWAVIEFDQFLSLRGVAIHKDEGPKVLAHKEFLEFQNADENIHIPTAIQSVFQAPPCHRIWTQMPVAPTIIPWMMNEDTEVLGNFVITI